MQFCLDVGNMEFCLTMPELKLREKTLDLCTISLVFVVYIRVDFCFDYYIIATRLRC